MEAEISMRMQKVTFLLCVTLDHSLILEAGGLRGGGGGAAPPGKWRLFHKMPSASCIIEIHCLLFAKGATVGFSVCLWADVYILIRGSAETALHLFLHPVPSPHSHARLCRGFEFLSTSHVKARSLQNVKSCASGC